MMISLELLSTVLLVLTYPPTPFSFMVRPQLLKHV
jgi:hypothetical protein